MTLQSLSKTNSPPRILRGEVPQVTSQIWTRHPAWAAMPSVTSADAKVAGIYAIHPESNFLAMTCAGNYTVDWGDGTAPENVSSGVSAYHEYDYADSDLANTNGPVTFTDSGDLVNRTAHGFLDGQQCAFFNIVSTTGLTEGAAYYVINASTNSFQVSTQPNGSAVALTTDGSGALLPYKQAVVVITPNGGTLTQVNLSTKHNKTGLNNGMMTGWLDLSVGGKDFDSTGMTLSLATNVVRHQLLERFVCASLGSQSSMTSFFNDCYALRSAVELGETTAAVTNMFQMFANCLNLVTVPLFNTSAATTMVFMFSACTELRDVPLFNTVSVNTMASMFVGCKQLTTVPLFNTVAVTSMNGMFNACPALVDVPKFNTPALTTFAQMFNACTALRSVPLFNTAGVTSFATLFNGCTSLVAAPKYDMTAATSLNSMFQSCSSLKTVPAYNAASVADFGNMFTQCIALESAPLINIAASATCTNMFNGCISLKTVPALNFSSVTNMSAIFSGCRSLETVPAITASNATSSSSYSSMFNNCSSLSKISMTGHKFTFSVANNKLSSAALDELYGNLATVGAATITVTGNHGVAADTPSIATAKGWTVTG